MDGFIHCTIVDCRSVNVYNKQWRQFMRITKDPILRRQELIDAARELFIDAGVSKTSVAKIAAHVGVAKGLFYYYFETKEDVLMAVIEDLCDKHIAQLNIRFEEEAHDFYSRLLIFIDAYYDIHPDSHGDELFDGELIHNFHHTYLMKVEDILNDIVIEGQASGELDLKHPNEMIIMTLDGVFALKNMRDISRDMVSVMIEQSLNFADGSLAVHSEKYLVNFERG